jgi:hypothetical protein
MSLPPTSTLITQAEHRLSLIQARLYEQNEILNKLKSNTKQQQNIIAFTGPANRQGLDLFLSTTQHGNTWDLITKYYTATVTARVETNLSSAVNKEIKAVVMVFGPGQFTEEEASAKVSQIHSNVEVKLCWILDENERMIQGKRIREWCIGSGVEFLEEDDSYHMRMQQQQMTKQDAVIYRLVDALSVASWSNMIKKNVVLGNNNNGKSLLQQQQQPESQDWDKIDDDDEPSHVPVHTTTTALTFTPTTTTTEQDDDDDNNNQDINLESLLHQMRAHKAQLSHAQQNGNHQMSDQERRDKAAALVLRMMESLMKDDEEEGNESNEDT